MCASTRTFPSSTSATSTNTDTDNGAPASPHTRTRTPTTPLALTHTPLALTHTLIALYALLALLPLASCSLYPTQPVENTIWKTGQTVRVAWRDDGAYPVLGEMGRCEVGLFWDDDTFVMTLASDVDPQSRSLQFVVPGDVVRDGEGKYTLRFTTNDPYDMTIYSADFSIAAGGVDTSTGAGASTDANNAPTGSTSPTGTSGNDLAMDTSATSSAALASQGRMTMTTLTSSSSSTTTTTTATMGATPSMISSDQSSEPSTTMLSAPPLRPGDVSGSSSQQQQGTGIGNPKYSNAGRRIDVEKIKFRIVFVIWPVLMGITMAFVIFAPGDTFLRICITCFFKFETDDPRYMNEMVGEIHMRMTTLPGKGKYCSLEKGGAVFKDSNELLVRHGAQQDAL
ncbi:hypothetical protein F5I97DRAFT_1826651 [Phlebopus sp. FC_14]|nr:hypothetical protein F5I97DRAFT_1826651 [Phlebopus sp. FC_14]